MTINERKGYYIDKTFTHNSQAFMEVTTMYCLENTFTNLDMVNIGPTKNKSK